MLLLCAPKTCVTMPAKKAISPRSQPVKTAIHLQSTKINKNPFVTCTFRPGLKAFEALLIYYISITNTTSLTNLFSLVFAFLQTALNFSPILSTLFKSSSVNFLAKFVRNFMQTGRNRTTTTKHHYNITGMSFQKISMTPFTKRVLEHTLPTPTPLSYLSENSRYCSHFASEIFSPPLPWPFSWNFQ